MDFTFACPHCGIVTQIDSSHLGETGPCRACDVEVTVPFPDQLDETDSVVNELNEHDEAEARVEEQEEGLARQVGGRIIRFAVVAVLLLIAGRVALNINSSPSRPRPQVEIFRDPAVNLEELRRLQPKQLRGTDGREIADEVNKGVVEELLKSGRVYRYSPNGLPQRAWPQ